MTLLESEETIITGKLIHKDLCMVLGRQDGWRAVDLGVWTRDLLYHGHQENGLKRMMKETIGFNIRSWWCQRSQTVWTGRSLDT